MCKMMGSAAVSNVLVTGLAAVGLSLLTSCISTPTDTLARVPASQKNPYEVLLHDGEKNGFAVGDPNPIKFSLDSSAERASLQTAITTLLKEKKDKLPKDGITALKEADRLLKKMQSENLVSSSGESDFQRLREVMDAYNSNYQSPIPTKLWVGAIPYEFLKMYSHNMMYRHDGVASNLMPYRSSDDVSKIDPQPSAFWQPGREIESLNFYYGLGRKKFPNLVGPCKYEEPKKSYGVHGGFKVKCGNDKWKLKFGNESKTEPFNSRIVWALGYNATAIDYQPEGLRIVYDRKLITEYHSRKDLKADIKSLLGFSYFTKNLQVGLDPFDDALAGAELTDGSFIQGQDLRNKLIASMPQNGSKDDWTKIEDAKFNEAFEKKIAFFVLKEASVEGPRKNQDDLGSWSWRTDYHACRRELRAFGIFSGWVNLFDVRQNNNRLSLEETKVKGETKLVQSVSDLGSGFGQASDLLHYRNNMPNDYPWDFIRRREEEVEVGPSGKTVRIKQNPIEIVHYSPIEKNEAFANMNWDDARWMGRRLARISVGQMQDALIASGYSAAETTLLLEKLLSRRQQIITVLKLDEEFPAEAARTIRRKIDFDSERDEVPKANGASPVVKARLTKQKLVNGKLID